MKFKPQPLKLIVEKTEWISTKVLQLTFQVEDPGEFKYHAGQHINLKVSDVDGRPYSLVSNPKDGNKISIVVSAKHDGVGANFLRNLKVGDIVEGLGPTGQFHLRESLSENLIFVATGSGMGQIYSLLSALADKKIKNNIVLYFGVGNEEEIFFEKKLENLKKSLLNFRYEICLSGPSKNWRGNIGWVNKHIKIKDPDNTQVYMSGVKAMVEDLRPWLIEMGVSEENIVFR